MQLQQLINKATTQQIIVVAFFVAVLYLAYKNRHLISAKIEGQ